MLGILYIGNASSSYGAQPSHMEQLIPWLKRKYIVQYGSGNKNPFLRMIDYFFLVFSNRKSTDLILLDIYSGSYFYAMFLVSLMARLLKIPYVCVLRGGNLPWRLQKSRTLSTYLFGNANSLVAPSEYLKKEFEERGYSAIVIDNTVDHDFFNICNPRINIRPKFIYVRSLKNDYNPLMAVQILNELKRYYPEASLCMIGSKNAANLKSIEKFVQNHNLERNFTYKGCLTKDEWFRLSEEYDIYLSTTNIDNTPVSLLEAYNLGLLVATTDVGGIKYIAADNQTAILFKPKDYKEAATLIKEVLDDKERSALICSQGYLYGKQFSISNIINKWYSLIDSVITSRN